MTRESLLLKGLLAPCLLCLPAICWGETREITIGEDGVAKAEIVIPEEPSYVVKFAAGELKQYLDKMTGGDFKITSTPAAPVKMYLGQCPEAKAAGLAPKTLKRDGFFINAKGNAIFIVGVDNPSTFPSGQGKSHFFAPFVDRDKPDPSLPVNLFHLLFDETRRGTLLGVYEFLEQLGVRWPAPGPDHEVVPKLATIRIPEGTQKIEPFFRDRKLTGLWDFMNREWPGNVKPIYPDAKEYCRNVNDMYLWGLRLKLSDRSMVFGEHSEETLRLKTIWADHPERFALNPYRNPANYDGKRNMGFLCRTEPAVAEMWEKAADAYFSGKTPADAGLSHLPAVWPYPFFLKDEFMINPADHYGPFDGRCRCDRCNAFREKYPCADDTEILWKTIAEVAQSIKKKHPGKFITALVYSSARGFPKYVKVPDNVRVRICFTGSNDIVLPNRLKPDLDLVKAWSNALNVKPVLWTYQCHTAFGRNLPGPPETYPHLIARFLDKTRNDIAGMFFEQHALTHTYRNLDMYVAARLMWNPDLDLEAELADYFTAYYGPGAKPARELFRRFEDNWVKYYKLAIPDLPRSETVGLILPSKDLQKLVWSKVYTAEEMDRIDSLVTAVEKACAKDPLYLKRASLLRTWILDIMKMERG